MRRDGTRSIDAWFRARVQEALALALASPAIAGCSSNGAHGGADASTVGANDAAAPLDAGVCASIVLDAAAFGSDASCDNYVLLPCGVPAGSVGIGPCIPDYDLCTQVCPGSYLTCVFPACALEAGAEDAGVIIECDKCTGGVGRATAGLAIPPSDPDAPRVGDYFARVAYLEAASIDAFHALEARLAAHGAPVRLLKGAARAARDERRHARVTARLARAFGGKPRKPKRPASTALSLEELAVDNAVEGCVRESMGAVVAAYQARCATDVRVARAMRRIAEDEARHAALAWAIDAWLAPRLDAPARERVRRAKREALERLQAEAASPASREVSSVAGVPSAARGACLSAAFARALGSAVA